MISVENNCFLLSTDNTAYAFRILPTGQPEHLHYGPPVRMEDLPFLTEKRAFPAGNTISYDKDHPEVTLEDLCLEFSSCGKGDIREPFVEIVYENGSRTSDFVFENYECPGTRPDWGILPGSYAGDAAEAGGTSAMTGGDSAVSAGKPGRCLVVRFREKTHAVQLELLYIVYPETDVICRQARLLNTGAERLRLLRFLSTQVDFPSNGFVVSHFHGAWAHEMKRSSTTVTSGLFAISSFTGTSSNRSNPFVMLSRPQTTEGSGVCYGFNLIYSGNHYEALEVNAYDKSRFVSGINPRGFEFLLEPGESFTAPEAVMSFSDRGFTGLSRNLHAFIRSHILRGCWKDKERPILLNSWEACYFDLSESRLLSLAKTAKDAGIELFVMDDGWFKGRNSDSTSLGDWEADPKKLPGGLRSLSEKVHALGLLFGIWVEPEMVNVNSDLYRAHPDWVLQISEESHSEGRNQRILDLANPAVVDHLESAMARVFAESSADYVKWDMNRIFSDVFSPYLPAERQGEVFHRYVLGLYDLMTRLTRRFPKILFEGCASGGNRFDLGILCFFPQIWASDNTDAVCRVHQQENYSFGYPLSCLGAHVSSCPNHQTLRDTPLETRFAAAVFGLLGYELDLRDLKPEERAKIKEQTSLYKKWRAVLQNGTFYRGRHGNTHEWICVSPDRSRAVGFLFQALVHPNTQYETFHAKGLDPDAVYHFYNNPEKVDIRKFGSLINTEAPVHVRQDSLMHNVIAHFMSFPGEEEDALISGRALMSPGLRLKQAFSGTGFNEEVRHFQDFSARLYFMEKV